MALFHLSSRLSLSLFRPTKHENSGGEKSGTTVERINVAHDDVPTRIKLLHFEESPPAISSPIKRENLGETDVSNWIPLLSPPF